MAAAAVAFGLTACSDWDDHYSADSTTGGSGASLWETISANQNLSDFASLLKRTGYNDVLATEQVYTVWAPENSVLDSKMDSLAGVTDSALVAEFIKNHITRGSFLASGDIDENVHMLNGKVKNFKSEAAAYYYMDQIRLTNTNIPVGNGVLHTLKDQINFEPNIYEYLFRNSNTSEIAAFFNSYYTKEIDTENSVAGPMKNGELSYLDTVYVEDNELFSQFNAKIDVEDSSYTYIIPTNTAWNKAVEHQQQYFQYPTTGAYNTFTVTIDQGDLKVTQGSTENVDGDSLKNENIKRNILADLAFSHNVNDNAKLQTRTSGLDSLVSTTGTVFKNSYLTESGERVQLGDADEIFKDPNLKWQALSNGQAYITDTLLMRPWMTWNPIMTVNASSAAIGARYASSATSVRVSSTERIDTVPGSLHGISSYYMVTASATGAKPEAYFYGPNLLSQQYAVYMTMVPANLTDTLAGHNPVALRVGTIFHGASGAINGTSFDVISRYVDEIDGKHGAHDITFDFDKNDRVQTKFVGMYGRNSRGAAIALASYAGMEDASGVNPAFSVEVKTAATTNRGVATGYDNNLRILNFIFVPKELIDYYRAQGVIDDFTGNMPEFFWGLIPSSSGSSYSDYYDY